MKLQNIVTALIMRERCGEDSNIKISDKDLFETIRVCVDMMDDPKYVFKSEKYINSVVKVEKC